jgi:N-methylhydantoinase A
LTQARDKLTEEDTVRLGVDVGGTFTDFALATSEGIRTLKLLTTSDAPERAIIDGVVRLLEENSLLAEQIVGFIHGTTLATNAIISRTGARTALLTTEGFRDVLALGDESRFDQYDVNILKPRPLVPRWWRFSIRERLSAQGDVLLPLDEASIDLIAKQLKDENIESIAICFLHAHINSSHEQCVRERLQELLPNLIISLSSEVSPEVGEYERFSTTAANAYVQPVIGSYLERLKQGLLSLGIHTPIFMFLSNGGLCDLDTAYRFPIRLVESGPAGGAIFAANIASDLGEKEILAFDMGGTTAKICLIDDGVPQRSDSFEMAREHMHRKGSGLPVRIPVIDMVEIGAGGGSIAHVDSLKRIQIGPESAGAMPGPACYNRGGIHATVTDANILVGRLAPGDFTGSDISISVDKARLAVNEHVGSKLKLEDPAAAFAISEMVEEQMAGAAREHAREKGVDLRKRTLVAFGGGAPLHAAKVAQKLGIERIIVPLAAGVGAAVGFLQSQVIFDISHSIKLDLSEFRADIFNQEFLNISESAKAAVSSAAPNSPIEENRDVFMRYRGQGHSLAVSIANQDLSNNDGKMLRDLFTKKYVSVYRRALQGVAIECVGISLRVSTCDPSLVAKNLQEKSIGSVPTKEKLFNLDKNTYVAVPSMLRTELYRDQIFQGPGLIKDYGTTIYVPQGYSAECVKNGHMLITKQSLV